MLKRNLLLFCMAMLVGGVVVMKAVLSWRASKARPMSFLQAAFATQWLRDDSGHIRWFIRAWVLFWFLAFLIVGWFGK